jgi:hypothetical protein
MDGDDGATADANPAVAGPLSTGLPALDEALGGGLDPGSLVALVGGPDAPTEPLLYAAARPRPTRYLTALRPRAEVEAALARHDAGAASVEAVAGEALLDAPEDRLSGLDAGATLVVDPVTDAEQGGREPYRAFLSATARALRATGGVGVFGCYETRPATLRRDLTLARADHVWRLRLHAGARVTVRLTVHKARGRPLPDRAFDLEVAGDGLVARPADPDPAPAPD